VEASFETLSHFTGAGTVHPKTQFLNPSKKGGVIVGFDCVEGFDHGKMFGPELVLFQKGNATYEEHGFIEGGQCYRQV